MYNIAIIGAGINGLGSALRIKEKYPSYKITIITKDVTPNTTGDGSAGLWSPYLLGATPGEKILQWSRETHDLFLSLWQQGVAGSCLIPCLRIDNIDDPLPVWRNVVYGYRNLEGDELQYWKTLLSLDISMIQYFVSFTCEPKLLLKYLMDRLLQNGVVLKMQEVTNIADVTKDYDVVINCTGLGSKLVVPDSGMYSIRGQVARVKAPWMYYIMINDSSGNYIIPNTNTCVLGGTHQEDDYNRIVDPTDTKFIRDGCESLIPGLKHQPTVFEWVGLRPGRDSVRLELEMNNTNDCDEKIIIHNYGHGGSGITLFWGCAKEVTDILTSVLEKRTPCKL